MKKLKEYSAAKKDESINFRRAFFWVINDFKYLMKIDTIKAMLGTQVVEELIDHFQTIWMSDQLKVRDHHINHSSEGYFYEGLDYQYLTLKLALNIIKEINYTDLKFARKLANLFYDKIVKLDDWWIQNHDKRGYLNIPLLRVFSVFLSKYIMTNYLIIENKQDQEIIESRTPKEIISNLISTLFNKLKKKEIEHLLEISVKVSSRTIGFIHEISSEKWFYYGYEISALPKLLINDLNKYFINPDFVLIQMMFIFSSNSKILLKNFIEGYSIDGSIQHIFTNMIFSPDEYIHHSASISKDKSNLKHMLYLFISLLSNDRFFYFWWNPHKKKLVYK